MHPSLLSPQVWLRIAAPDLNEVEARKKTKFDVSKFDQRVLDLYGESYVLAIEGTGFAALRLAPRL